MRYALEVIDGVNLLSGSTPLPEDAIEPISNWEELIGVPWFFRKVVDGQVVIKTTQEKQDYLDANPQPTEEIYLFFKLAHSIEFSSTIGTSWVEKVKMVTEDLPLGTYRIGWTYAYKVESADVNLNPTFRARIRVNNEKDIRQIKTQPIPGANAVPSVGFAYWELSGETEIVFEFRRIGDEGIVSVSDVILELWRASNDIGISPIKTGSDDLIKTEIAEVPSFRTITLE